MPLVYENTIININNLMDTVWTRLHRKDRDGFTSERSSLNADLANFRRHVNAPPCLCTLSPHLEYTSLLCPLSHSARHGAVCGRGQTTAESCNRDLDPNLDPDPEPELDPDLAVERRQTCMTWIRWWSERQTRRRGGRSSSLCLPLYQHSWTPSRWRWWVMCVCLCT